MSDVFVPRVGEWASLEGRVNEHLMTGVFDDGVFDFGCGWAAVGSEISPPTHGVKCDVCAEIERKEQLNALRVKLTAVGVLARRWAGLADADDWGDTMHETVVADCGRAILAILDGKDKP